MMPWERYAAQSQPAMEQAGPWMKYAQAPQQEQAPQQAEVRSYDPTTREKIGAFIAGDNQNPYRRALAEGIVGSRGLGKTDGGGLVDLTPAGIPLQVQEAAREGDAQGVALSFLPMAPAARPLSRAPMPRPQAPAPMQGPLPRQELFMQTAQERGVTVPRGIASESPAVNRINASVANAPLAGEPIVSASRKMSDDIGRGVEDVSRQLGSGSRDVAGPKAKAEITSFVTTRPDENSAYGAAETIRRQHLEASPNPVVETPLNATHSMAADIALNRENARLTKTSPALKMIEDAIATPGMDYYGIKDLRSAVRKLKDDKLDTSMDKGELKRILSALTVDLKNNLLASGGPAALAAWEAANATSRLNAMQRKALEKVIGSRGDAPAEKVFDTIVALGSSKARGDVQRFALVKSVIGNDAWDDVASAVVSRLGRDADGNFSPTRFTGPNGYNSLSDRAKGLLFSTEHKKALDDLQFISREFEHRFTIYGNPSGTARNLAGIGAGTAALTEILAGGIPWVTLTTALGGRIVASALAEPATAKAVTNWARTQLRVASFQKPNKATIAAGLTANQALSSALADAGLGDAKQILTQLQGAGSVRADQNQEQ